VLVERSIKEAKRAAERRRKLDDLHGMPVLEGRNEVWRMLRA